jgi:hypothetical protein
MNKVYDASYHDRSLCTDRVVELADLHDLIVDAPKNGLSYDRPQLTELLRKSHHRRPKETQTTAFRTTLTANTLHSAMRRR